MKRSLRFKYMSNQENVTLSMWFSGEPNGEDEDFVEMGTRGGNFGWNDIPGHFLQKVVCEKEFPPSSSKNGKLFVYSLYSRQSGLGLVIVKK